jgi:hypothetical protein
MNEEDLMKHVRFSFVLLSMIAVSAAYADNPPSSAGQTATIPQAQRIPSANDGQVNDVQNSANQKGAHASAAHAKALDDFLSRGQELDQIYRRATSDSGR